MFQALQDLLPAIREERVLDFVDDVDFLMFEIHRSAARSDNLRRQAPDGSFGRNIAVVGNIPNSHERLSDIPCDLNARRFIGRDDLSTFGNTGKTLQRVNAGVRSGDDLAGSHIAIVRPVEYQNSLRIRIADGDDVVNRVHGNSAGSENPGLRSGNYSHWSDVAVGGPGEDEDRLPCGNYDFVVNTVQRQFVIFLEKSLRTLDYSDWRRVTTRASGVKKNRLGQRIRDDDLVVLVVISDRV